jgi:hypothetical protein
METPSSSGGSTGLGAILPTSSASSQNSNTARSTSNH